jgi:hypothetical protein
MTPSDLEILQLYELEWMLDEESSPRRRVKRAGSFVQTILCMCASAGAAWLPTKALAQWLFSGLPK